MKSKYRNNREDQNPEPERHAVWEKTFNFSPVPYSSNNRSRKKNFCQQIQDVISDSNFIYVDLLLDMRIELYTNLKELHRIHKVPDLDNSLKLICDSLKGAKGLVIDDCQFQHISISTIDTCLSPHFRIEIRSISDEYMMKPVSLFEMPDGLYYPLSITTLDSEEKRNIFLTSIYRLVRSSGDVFKNLINSGLEQTVAFHSSSYLFPILKGFPRSRISKSGFELVRFKDWFDNPDIKEMVAK